VSQQDDTFTIAGVEVYQVTIVGIVRSVKESATRLDYEIDDMTGPPLEVKQFVDNDTDTPDNERTVAMRENTYVRMYGHVRGFGGKISIVAFRVVPLVDLNELTMHLLEVIHSHMVFSRAQTNEGNAGSAQQGMDYTAEGTGFQADYGLTPIQSQVQTVIRSCPDEQGISVTNIAQKLRGLSSQSLKEAIEFLSGEGHIYSTVDDEHYRSTDAM
jgi:replication factor A2